MQFFIPFPSRRDELTRTARIRQNAPQASASLERIERSSADLPFGSSISRVLDNYHFPTTKEVEEYFRLYLAQQSGGYIDEGMVTRCTEDTINRLPAHSPRDRSANSHLFHDIFKELNRQIDTSSADNVPVVNFIVGATGAGKTAFSKSLFTVCLANFWAVKIIPSRVEYSKYWDDSSLRLGESEFELDKAFFAFVHRCQLRDLLIYFFTSDVYSEAELKTHIAKLTLAGNAERKLMELLDSTRGLIIDGEEQLLNSQNRRLFDLAVTELREDRDKVLHRLSKALGIRFLVSFDGFDSTKIEHFLFERSRNLPIYYLVRTLKGAHKKISNPHMGDMNLDTHYLAYLRDTTFSRLRTELFRDVGGSVHYPVYWIVPPAYPLLVQNAATFLTGMRNPVTNLANTFSADIISAFDRAVFDRMDLNASTHLPFVFGSSARRMKFHIKHVLIAALHREWQAGKFDFVRDDSGIDAKTVWQELVRTRSVRTLPGYLVLEDLFLNEARQLIPKLELDPTVVTELLDEGDFNALLAHIMDVDETCGIFGCLFNYFYHLTIGTGDRRQPAMLILLRIIQYVRRNPRCTANAVLGFMRNIGYNISKDVGHFCLFVIIRAEIIKWDGTRGARTISDVPLYVTTPGEIVVEKLLFSISYMSEAFISSIQIDQELARGLRGRVPDNTVWIADCINNASIALHVIREIEAIEREAADANAIKFEEYALYDRLHAKLSREARAIKSSSMKRIRERWEENYTSLSTLRSSYPGLVILGENE